MTWTFKLTPNGDVDHSRSTGRPIKLTDKPKLLQDLAIASSIETQPDGWGFGLKSVVGLVGDAFAVRAVFSQRIRDGIAAIQRLQNRYMRRSRTPEERISRLASVQVSPMITPGGSTVAKTTYAFRYDVVSVAGDRVATSGAEESPS